MKRFISLFIVLSFYSASLIAQQKQIDIDKSELKWTGKASVTGNELSGTLAFNSGSITVKEGRILQTNIEVNMLSLEAENETLKEHLREEDFFNVEKYQIATFKLTNQPVISNGIFEMRGQMEIKGKTQEVISELEFETVKELIVVSGKIIIDRTKFGIYHDSPSFFVRLKEKAIVDEFEIDFKIIFK